jgi:hypothetical protein
MGTCLALALIFPSFISFSVSLLNLCLLVCVGLLWVFAFLVDPVVWGRKMTINSTGGLAGSADWGGEDEDVC